jgi:hypothetical protein
MVAAPLAAYAGLCFLKPLYHPKYVLPWLAFAALAVGALAARRRVAGTAAGLALILLMAWPAWRTISLPYPSGLDSTYDSWLPPPPERDMARALDTLMGPIDIFALGTPDPLPCFFTQNYTPRDLGCLLWPAYPQQTVSELAGQIDQTLQTHRLLWFMQFYNPVWDPNHVAKAALAQSAVYLGVEDLPTRSFDLYTSPQTILHQQLPIGARLGDAAVLEGAWLVQGRTLKLVLTWTASPDAPPGLKVFVHERDETGAIVAQADHDWLEGAQHFGAQWFTVHTLPMPSTLSPPPQTFALGLYNSTTMARLPAYSPGGERLPDDAEIVPLAAFSQP